MKPALRKAIAKFDAECIAARRRIDSNWLDRRLASMTPIADDRDAQYAAAKLALSAEFGIPSNLA